MWLSRILIPTLAMLSLAYADGSAAGDASTTSDPVTTQPQAGVAAWDRMVDESMALLAGSTKTIADFLRHQDKKGDNLVFLAATGDKVRIAYSSKAPKTLGNGSIAAEFVVYLPTQYHVNKATSGLPPGKDVDLTAILTVVTSYAEGDGATGGQVRIETLSLEGLWPTDEEGRKHQAEHVAKLAASLEGQDSRPAAGKP